MTKRDRLKELIHDNSENSECCIHKSVCAFSKSDICSRHCPGYSPRSQWLHIPPAKTTVYAVATPCYGCEKFERVPDEEVQAACRECGKREIIEIAYDDELLSELGKTVFETRDKALMALKSMEPKEKSKAHNS